MSRPLTFSLLLTAFCAFLVYLGAPEGVMLCGGAPCIIILEGNLAYGAIEEWQTSTGSTLAVLARLKAAIQASCALVSYGSLYREIDNGELTGPVLDKIIAFHRKVTAAFRTGGPSNDYVVFDETMRIERYNRRLVNVIAGEPAYPESSTSSDG